MGLVAQGNRQLAERRMNKKRVSFFLMALRHSSCRQQLIVEEERAACVAMGRWEGRAAKAAARLAGVGRAAAISSNEPQLQYMETVAEVRESKSIKARDPEM